MADAIAIRTLVLINKTGEKIKFDISIGKPRKTDESEYICEIYSDDILFLGVKNAFGIDGVDCIDAALKIIDIFTDTLSSGSLYWSDGSPYTRVPATNRMDWGYRGKNE